MGYKNSLEALRPPESTGILLPSPRGDSHRRLVCSIIPKVPTPATAPTEKNALQRAQATIEKGFIQLANPWLERRWNAFMGTTTELLWLPERRDCLAQKSPEFHLEMDGRVMAAQDLGDVGWTDTSDGHAAAVVLSLSGPGVTIQLETVLLHRCPGMIRTLTVTNTGGSPATVTRAAVDVLPLDPTVYGGRVESSTRFTAESKGDSIHYAALPGTSDQFFLGAYRKARFVLFDPNPAYCAAVWEGSALIPPGKSWRAPSTMLYGCRGLSEPAIQTTLQAFHQAWEARKAAEAGLHPSRN
jgi:hypothetical protein